MSISSPTQNDALTPEDLIATVRRDLEDGRTVGSLSNVDDAELDRITAESVHALWNYSRVKSFLPVLSIRRARQRLENAVASRRGSISGLSSAQVSLSDLVAELGGDLDLYLTYSHSAQWQAVLVNRHRGDVPMTVRVEAHGRTVDDALQAVATKARDFVSS